MFDMTSNTQAGEHAAKQQQLDGGYTYIFMYVWRSSSD